MKKTFNYSFPVLFIGAFFFCITDLSGQCDAILNQGIYDYRSTSTSREKSSSFINWYKNQNIQTFQEAKSAAGNAKIPLESIIVNMGFSYNESGFRKFQSYVENYTFKSEIEKSKFDETIRTINPTVVSAWNDCIKRYGLHVWIEHTNNPYEFVLCANFIDDAGGGNPAQITGIDFGSGKISTTSSIFYNKGTINDNTVLSGTIKRQIFIRQNNNAFNIVVNVSRGEGLLYSFSQIIERKKPILKTKILVLTENENCIEGDCKNIENIESIEYLSCKLGNRSTNKGNEYKFNIIEPSEPRFKTLKFGRWENPQCEGKVTNSDGKAQGDGWHIHGVSSCTTGRGDGIGDVIEVKVQVKYWE